jgi:predicted Rossmann fold flavoprotein
MNQYDVIVIGAGPAGMMAAGISAQGGKRVLILEKNKQIGEKLRISGGGRCNITNAETDIHKFLEKYGENNKFLYSPFSQFNNTDTFKFFEKLGLPLVTQGLGRVFPHTEKAVDVCNVLEKFMSEEGITVKTKRPVTKINFENRKIISVACGSEIYTADSYILATGGVSHPETGSTGDGFKWLKDLGHTAVEPTPSIVPVSVSDEWIKVLAGKSFDDVKITFFVNGKKSFSKQGRILATHFGLSGPMILNSAHQIADLLHEGSVTAEINLFPGKDLGAIERQIIELFDANKNKSFKTVFRELVPVGMGSGIIELVDFIEHDLKVHSITKESRKQLVKLLTALPVHITDLMGFDRAVIADGGIPLEEIDTKTMRSKVIENLFITGDLLHVNRPSGGYSLQLCWTTGFVAGKNA